MSVTACFLHALAPDRSRRLNILYISLIMLPVFAGVSVLGLGALNKAEFINRGGEDVLDAFMPRTTR